MWSGRQLIALRRPDGHSQAIISSRRPHGDRRPQAAASVAAKPEALGKYMWERKIRFVQCSHCGAIMYYEYASPRSQKSIAVRARNFGTAHPVRGFRDRSPLSNRHSVEAKVGWVLYRPTLPYFVRKALRAAPIIRLCVRSDNATQPRALALAST